MTCFYSRNSSLPVEGKKTSVRAEICAAMLALKIAKQEGMSILVYILQYLGTGMLLL